MPTTARLRLLLATACLAFMVFPGISAQANAATINLSSSGNWDGLSGLYRSTMNIFLPKNAINPMLSITNFTVDDRAVLTFNDLVVDATGIFASDGTVGSFNFEKNTPAVPYTFNAPALRSINVTTGFVLGGDNSFTFIGNDTGFGIYGETLEFAQLSIYAYEAKITYDLGVTAVPEPAAWALMIGGFGLVGGTLRRTGRMAKRSFATA